MPDQTHVSSGAKVSNDKASQHSPSKVKFDKIPIPDAAISKPVKEHEIAVSTGEAASEILERDKVAEKKVEKEIKEVAGEEARLKEVEVEIPPDVRDAGVKSPEKEASEVLEKGTLVELPISEKEYQEGQHTKLTSKVTVKREVWGVSGIIAMAIFIGRLIKKAHHHAKSIVFKKEG